MLIFKGIRKIVLFYLKMTKEERGKRWKGHWGFNFRNGKLLLFLLKFEWNNCVCGGPVFRCRLIEDCFILSVSRKNCKHAINCFCPLPVSRFCFLFCVIFSIPLSVFGLLALHHKFSSKFYFVFIWPSNF